MRQRSALWILLLLCVPVPGLAHTAVFVQGASDAQGLSAVYQTDITMISGNPTDSGAYPEFEVLNWGGANRIDVGRIRTVLQRPLLRFPLAGLAGRATRITGARLILSLAYYPSLDPPTPQFSLPLALTLHRVAPANAGWVEGAGMGTQAPGAACWGWRTQGIDRWAGSRGCSQPGVDYFANPVSTATLTSLLWPTGQHLVFEIPDPSFLQGWIDHPETNTGFLLRAKALEALSTATLASILFFADDFATINYRPRLEVDYESWAPGPLEAAAFQERVVARFSDPGYDAMGTSLDSANPNASCGGAADLRVGIEPATPSARLWRSLLKFDLSRLRDVGYAVRGARLTLTVQTVTSSSRFMKDFHALQLDRVCPANADWREGKSLGTIEAGAACWSWLAQGSRGWAGAAGLGAAGSDYDLSPLAQRVIVPADLHDGDTLSFDITSGRWLRDWIAQPAANAGFRLSCPTLEGVLPTAPGLVVFHSDDAVRPDRRPRLEVFYSTVAIPSLAAPAWSALE